MLKISVISRVRSTSEIADTSTHSKKSKFPFYFFPLRRKNLNLFASYFSLNLLGSARLVGIILGVKAV